MLEPRQTSLAGVVRGTVASSLRQGVLWELGVRRIFSQGPAPGAVDGTFARNLRHELSSEPSRRTFAKDFNRNFRQELSPGTFTMDFRRSFRQVVATESQTIVSTVCQMYGNPVGNPRTIKTRPNRKGTAATTVCEVWQFSRQFTGNSRQFGSEISNSGPAAQKKRGKTWVGRQFATPTVPFYNTK